MPRLWMISSSWLIYCRNIQSRMVGYESNFENADFVKAMATLMKLKSNLWKRILRSQGHRFASFIFINVHWSTIVEFLFFDIHLSYEGETEIIWKSNKISELSTFHLKIISLSNTEMDNNTSSIHQQMATGENFFIINMTFHIISTSVNNISVLILAGGNLPDNTKNINKKRER